MSKDPTTQAPHRIRIARAAGPRAGVDGSFFLARTDPL
jgi:hypothetical protein